MKKGERKLSPLERLELLRKRLKKTKSLRGLRSGTSEVLKCKPADMREFKEKINNHSWKGIIYQKRNSLMGTIISLFDKKLFIVRGYPKIKYADASKVLNKVSFVQEKWDGTNLGIFLLPDGTLWGKTRLTHTWSQIAFKQEHSSWRDLFFEIQNGDIARRVQRLCSEKNAVVFGELYGAKIPSEFVKYSIPINFKGFDVVSLDTLAFLPPNKSLDLFFYYGIPRVENKWKGVLTLKEIERLEFELRKYVNSLEGFVAKSYDQEMRDTVFGKLKSEEIKLKCWEMVKALLPRSIISQAYKKVKENFPHILSHEEIYSLIREELLEEYSENLVDASKNRIMKIIEQKEQIDSELSKKVLREIELLSLKGIDLENTGAVMRELAKKFKGVSGKTLFNLYRRLKSQVENKN